MQDLHFYKVWLEKSSIGPLLPRTVFIFGFDKEKNIRESFRRGDYSTVDVTLLYGTGHDYPYWEEYLSEQKKELGYVIPYVDNDGNIYELAVDAIFRKNRLPSGELPIAMSTQEKVYYAGDDPFLVLPECFS